MAPARSSRGKQRRNARPEFLVVFRRGSRKGGELIAQITETQRDASREAHGMAIYSTASSRRVEPKLFDQLGIAALDLDESQHATFEQDDDVVAVVRNEKRFVQVVRDEPRRSLRRGYPGGGGRGGYPGGGGRGGYPPVPSRPGYRRSMASPPDLDAAAWSMYQAGLQEGYEAALAEARFGLPQHPLDQPGLAHSWCLDQIGLTRAYSHATGRDVKVAVLDTGIDLEHPDFENRLRVGTPWVDGDATAVSFVEGETVQDGNGHGTHCAGIVTGPLRSAGGRRYGVAPDAHLLVAKVLADDGSGFDSDILEGIAWAAAQGARIISMSLGSQRGINEPHSPAYERIAEEIFSDGDAPLLVAAAGNESERPDFVAPVGNPAACPSFMAVAAVDAFEETAWFSCGQRDATGLVDLAAPGVSVYSSLPGPERFGELNGTSMAAPHVSGVAALWLEQNPDWTSRQLWSAMIHHAHPLPIGSADVGRGIVRVP